MKRIVYGTLIVLVVLLIAGCELLGNMFSSAERPPIPEPTSYIGEVPTKSERLVVATVPLSDFTPVVDVVKDAVGNEVALPSEHMTLVEENVIIPTPDYSTGEGLPLATEPQIQLVRYWVRLGPPQRYPGGTTTSVTRSYTTGSEQSKTFEFGGSIGVSVTAGVDAVFASVSTTVSTEFSYNNTSTSTVSESTTDSSTFTVELEPDMNLVYCVWQLVDEYRIVHPNREVDDATGDQVWVTYHDDSYEFAPESMEPLTVYTNVIVPETTLFRN